MKIVKDKKWPGMYRIKLDDGTLTEMANLTRAKDAMAAAKELEELKKLQAELEKAEMALGASQEAAGEFCTLPATPIQGYLK